MNGIPFPNLSPEIFSISIFGFDFALRWYAMAYIVGILIGWRLIVAALKRPQLWRGDTAPMTPTEFEDLATWIIVGVIAGGRLGYVLFYNLSYYLAHPLEILMVWQGGMAFHGGFAGVIVATYVWSQKHQKGLPAVADVIAIAAPAGLLLGRIANFINAELWGRVTDVPWAVIFPGEAAQTCNEMICARHPSQLYEAALEGVILGAVMLWFAFRRGGLQRPWFMTGLFLSGYGVGRFIVEFVRQPDAQFISVGNPLGLAVHVGGYGLTMGQLLSLPMILIGAMLIRKAFRT